MLSLFHPDAANAKYDAKLLVDKMSRHSIADPTLAESAILMEWPMGRLEDAVACGVAAGELELWPDSPNGPSVALTPLAFSRAGVKVKDEDREDLPLGRKSGKVRPGQVVFHLVPGYTPARPVKRSQDARRRTELETDVNANAEQGFDLQNETDPLSGPADDAVARLIDAIEEYRDRPAGRTTSEWTTARINLERAVGQGCSMPSLGKPWSEWYRRDEFVMDDHRPCLACRLPCPACHYRELRDAEFCLRCRRGFEYVLEKAEPLPIDPPNLEYHPGEMRPKAPKPKDQRKRPPTGRPPGRPRKANGG